MMDLQENLQQVEANICKACENAGRKRSDVTLIAVSKTKPVEMLQTVYDLGPRDFGENKVQEMCEKMEVLPKDIRWHMIGCDDVEIFLSRLEKQIRAELQQLASLYFPREYKL